MQIKDGIVNGVLRVLEKLKAKSIEADEIVGNLTGNATTATTATKLGTANKGSATQPIYLNAGVPTATTYTLGKSVPSDAKFTDTVYTHPTTSGNKHIPSGGSSGQILSWSADGTAKWSSLDELNLPIAEEMSF